MSGVFLKILNMSITASWLILAVLALRLLFKKAPKWIMCLLWALAGVRLAFPFSFKSALSLIPSSKTVPESIALSPQPAVDTGIPFVNEAVNPALGSSLTPAPGASVTPLQVVLAVAAGVWLAGVLAMLVYALVSYLRLKKTAAVNVPAGAGVYFCDDVKTPFILGLFRPRICIPAGMEGQTLSCVLRHERAHLRRRDHWWKPLGFLLLSLHWFNPLCWAAYILLCRDIETACDEKVLREMSREETAAYSQALLDCSFPRKAVVACPLAFGEVGVKQRVKSVLNYKKPAFWIVLAALAACAAAAICLLTDPAAEKDLPDRLAVSMDTAVAERFGTNKDNVFAVSDCNVVKTERKWGKTTVYAWVMYAEFRWASPVIALDSEVEVYVPAAVTFDTSKRLSDDGAVYPVLRFVQGDPFSSDVSASVFPPRVAKKALRAQHECGQEQQRARCYEAATNYFVNGIVSNADVTLALLRKKYPEYFGLSVKNGLCVYIWEMAPGAYSCGLLPGDEAASEEDIWKLKSLTVDRMKAVLSSYGLPPEKIRIIPIHQPYSSYSYPIDDAYRKTVRALFFPDETDLSTRSEVIDAGWTQDSRIYAGCKNPEALAISSALHWPVYVFTTRSELESFRETAAAVFQDRTFIAAFQRYDAAFFKENTLLLAYATSGSISTGFDLYRVTRSGNKCMMLIEQREHDFNIYTMAGKFVLAVVPNALLEGCTQFDAYSLN